MIDPDRCGEVLLVPEQYRRHRRPGVRFRLHYTRRRCKRKAQPGRSFCWQHPIFGGDRYSAA